jgi:hypothetical protein
MAGYSATPLGKKLGLGDGMRALLLDVPADLVEISGFAGFAGTDRTLPDGADGRRYDYIHVFAVERQRLEAMSGPLRASLKPTGMLWISWPKKASKVPTTITEDVLRQVLLPTGLVDVKVAAVDATWSGLKFVFRKELRASL